MIFFQSIKFFILTFFNSYEKEKMGKILNKEQSDYLYKFNVKVVVIADKLKEEEKYYNELMRYTVIFIHYLFYSINFNLKNE
jgi:hypothetical protein